MQASAQSTLVVRRPGGAWSHSFEEDASGMRVYRPTHSFAFPPSRRGRETLSFDAAGQMQTGSPGPDDRQRSTSSSLTALGMNRYRMIDAEGGEKVIEIVEAGADLLKVRFA